MRIAKIDRQIPRIVYAEQWHASTNLARDFMQRFPNKRVDGDHCRSIDKLLHYITWNLDRLRRRIEDGTVDDEISVRTFNP
jgi:hypothetical protein